MAKTIFIDKGANADWREGLLANRPGTVRMLYAKHYPTVRQYILENNGRVADAEDMFQEAFMVLWLKVRSGGFEGSDPGGFLFQVAKNKWLDVVRSPAKRRMGMLGENHLRLVDERPVLDPVEERIGRLRQVYGLLDAKCRQVLDQFYYERKSLAMIAEAMGVEEESIRTIKYRCMMKLRAFRREIGGEE